MQTAAINPSTATALTVFFTFLFIAPFYLSSSLRTSVRVNRNSPSSIKARARSVFWVSAISTLITICVLVIYGSTTLLEVLKLLGLFPINLFDVTRSFVLVAILFAGPLFEDGIVEGNWRSWSSVSSFKRAVIDDWVALRNLVIGPVSEEVVFRSLSVSLYLVADVEPKEIVLTAPLIFGLAHAHHLNEHIIRHQQPGQSYLAAAMTPSVLLSGLVQVMFQFTYTSLFGIFTTFLYLRTGSLYACILAHSFCNYMGLPRVWGRVGRVASDEISGDDDSSLSATKNLREAFPRPPAEQSDGIGWTVMYYMLLSGGAYGFYKLLWPLTESSHALAAF